MIDFPLAHETFRGIPVMVVPKSFVTWNKQVKFPRSKKKRIIKKFKKNRNNYKDVEHILMVKGKMCMTEERFNQFKLNS